MSLSKQDMSDIGDIVVAAIEPVYERFDKMDERFDKMDERFDRLEGRVGNLEEGQNAILVTQKHIQDRLSSIEGSLEAVHNDIKDIYGMLPVEDDISAKKMLFKAQRQIITIAKEMGISQSELIQKANR